jgi:hypothetical protein
VTEDEKRQQKAMLLLEYQEADEHFAHLQEKAKRLSNNLLALSKWIEDRSQGYTVSGGSEDKVHVTEAGGWITILNNPDIAKTMDFEALKAVANELKQARARVQELSERKRSLGLK